VNANKRPGSVVRVVREFLDNTATGPAASVCASRTSVASGSFATCRQVTRTTVTPLATSVASRRRSFSNFRCEEGKANPSTSTTSRARRQKKPLHDCQRGRSLLARAAGPRGSAQEIVPPLPIWSTPVLRYSVLAQLCARNQTELVCRQKLDEMLVGSQSLQSRTTATTTEARSYLKHARCCPLQRGNSMAGRASG
jgi:hypothetical protein